MRLNVALISAAACAMITVGFASAVVVERLTASPPLVEIPGARPGTPGVAWTLSARDIVGNEFAVFENPATSTEYGGGSSGFIDAGKVLVTMTGLHNYRTGQFEKRQLVGVDAETGKKRWTTAVPALARCADQPAGNDIVCVTMPNDTHDKPDMINVDIDDGTLTEHAIDWTVVGIAAVGGDVLTLEGNPEDGDLRLHSGTPENPSSRWTVRVKGEASWEDTFGDVLTVSDRLALVQLGGDSVGIDVQTGKEIWSRHYPDCSMGAHLLPSGIAVRTRLDCLTQEVSESEAIGPTGRVIATAKSAAVNIPLLPSREADSPILMGDSAFDSVSGRKLWSNAALVNGPSAVVDGVVVVVEPAQHVLVGIDLVTGKELWQSPLKDTPAFGAAYRDCALSLQTPYITATNFHTGKQCWSLNTQSIVSGQHWNSPAKIQESDAGFVLAAGGNLVSLRLEN
ncbi:MAG: PQQ-like beta-propeller repeat protein [Nocardiaceae bacterium]|nr:PQQ-like beta-propeller repeat protein [Nocardiaceae bacterium]